ARGRAPAATLLPLFLSLGLAAGMVGVAFNRGLLWALRVFDSLPLRPAWIGAPAVGVVAAALGVCLPTVLGSGEYATEAIVQGRLALALGGFAALLVAKLVFTVASYGWGGPGGIFGATLPA